MTAEHEHPQYVTKADLEAFEGRIITRIGDVETRLSARLDHMVTQYQLLAVALAIIAVNLTVVGVSAGALFFALNNLAALTTAILGKLP